MQEPLLDVKAITPDMLATLLVNICRPETEIIKQSTAILKKYFELPDCVVPLLTHMATHTDDRVRLLSCIYLQKKLPQHWRAQAPALQQEAKVALLSRYTSERTPKITENIAYVIGALANLLTPGNEWPELFTFVVTNCNSDSLPDKQRGMALLLAIVESLGNTIEPYLTTIAGLLEKLITAQCLPVQLLAVKIINCITMSNITTESLAKLTNFIPITMEIVMRMEKDQTMLHEVFDNLTELIDIPKFLVPHLTLLITAALTVAMNKSLNSELRKVTLMFVQEAVSTKSKIIKKDKPLLTKVLEGTFEIASESEEGYEEDEETCVDAALDVLEQYAIRIPNTIIYPLLMSGCEIFLKSPDPMRRKAALLILGCVSKGVEDSFNNNLDNILSVVLPCIADPSVQVQEACVIALCYFADNLSPGIVEYHQKLLPPLLEAVHSKVDKVKTRVFYALETFCENLSEKEIVPYLEPLLRSLANYLDDPHMYPVLPLLL